MKKIISIISLCLVAVMLVSALTSCSNKKKFVGTWEELNENGEPNGSTMTLASDGTGSGKSYDGLTSSITWSVEGNKIFITVSACGITETSECSYKFSGDTLTLIDQDGEKAVYRKVKS